MALFKICIMYIIVMIAVGISSICLVASRFESLFKIFFSLFIIMLIGVFVGAFVFVLMLPDDIALKAVG